MKVFLWNDKCISQNSTWCWISSFLFSNFIWNYSKNKVNHEIKIRNKDSSFSRSDGSITFCGDPSRPMESRGTCLFILVVHRCTQSNRRLCRPRFGTGSSLKPSVLWVRAEDTPTQFRTLGILPRALVSWKPNKRESRGHGIGVPRASYSRRPTVQCIAGSQLFVTH